MLQQQTGVILVTALIFILIISLLAIHALESGYLQKRISNNLVSQIQALQAVEAGLYVAEQQLKQKHAMSCLFNEAIAKPWIRKSSCVFSFGESRVYYVIERLAGADCFAAKTATDELAVIGHYYRVTAWLSISVQPSVILQTTYAKPTTQLCENKKIVLQPPGRLSWREIE